MAILLCLKVEPSLPLDLRKLQTLGVGEMVLAKMMREFWIAKEQRVQLQENGGKFAEL